MKNYTNSELTEYKQFLSGKLCAVLGVGISNLPLIDFLLEAGAMVVARDKKEKSALCENKALDISRLERAGVKFVCGEDYLDSLCEDIIYKTPGLRYDNENIMRAAAAGSIVTSEMEAFLSICPCKIIAVTGSDGKTTTTTLIAKILEQAGHKVFLGGNIGKPLLYETKNMTPDDFAVLELSSFQLHTINKHKNAGLPTPKIRFPDVAVITNVSPNHLDWHTDYDEYIEAKKAIFSFMKSHGTLVTNACSDITKNYALQAEKLGLKVRTFSAKCECDYYLHGNDIISDGKPFMTRGDIKIPGIHNVENYMAAAAATQDFASREDVIKVAASFGGVEHRLELVRELCGVSYYNSSIDSSPSRTVAAVTSFGEQDKKKLILIMGGYDKNIPYAPIGKPVGEYAKAVFLCGATAPKIKEAIEQAGGDVRIYMCDSFKAAIDGARAEAASGDKVILTPASASFDMFKNFEERGRLFKEIVNNF